VQAIWGILFMRKITAMIAAAMMAAFPLATPVRAEVGVSKETPWSQKKDGDIEIFASCSASGNPPCSIDCPVGKAAVCTPGGLFPAKCECK